MLRPPRHVVVSGRGRGRRSCGCLHCWLCWCTAGRPRVLAHFGPAHGSSGLGGRGGTADSLQEPCTCSCSPPSVSCSALMIAQRAVGPAQDAVWVGRLWPLDAGVSSTCTGNARPRPGGAATAESSGGSSPAAVHVAKGARVLRTNSQSHLCLNRPEISAGTYLVWFPMLFVWRALLVYPVPRQLVLVKVGGLQPGCRSGAEAAAAAD